MQLQRAEELIGRMAARHAPPAGRVAWHTRRDGLRFVRLRERERIFGFSEACVLYLACVGEGTPTLEGVTLEPPELAELLEARVETVGRHARWSLLALTFAPVEGRRGELLARLADAPLFACRLEAPDVDNAGAFRVEVEACLPLLKVSPGVIELGTLDPVGGHWLSVETPGAHELLGPREELRILAERAPSQVRLALSDGLYQLRAPDGGVRELTLLRHRREVTVENRGQYAIRLTLVDCPAELGISPTALRLVPGSSARLTLAVRPSVVESLGELRWTIVYEREVEYSVHGRTAVAPADLVRLPVAARVACELPTLVLETRPILLGERSARERRVAFEVPYRLYGAGRVPVELSVVDPSGAPPRRPVFRVGARDALVALEPGCHPGTLRAEIDLAQLLLDGGRRYRVLLASDQPTHNLRRQSVPLEVEVQGRLLATRRLAVRVVGGLPYRVPLRFWVTGELEPESIRLQTIDVPERLAGRIEPYTGQSALPAAVIDSEEAAPPGGGLSNQDGLLLDLGGLVVSRAEALEGTISIFDPITGLATEVVLSVTIESPLQFLDGLTCTATAPDRAELVFRLTNPTDRAFEVSRVRVEGPQLTGFDPIEFPYEMTLAPGAGRRFRIPVQLPPRGALGWVRRLLRRPRRLTLVVGTDLPGDFAIAATVEVG